MRTPLPRSTPQNPRDYVQSLERGLAVIRSFGGNLELSLSQVAAQAGITRAAARRFLITLEQLGYVGHTGQAYRLLPRTLELGYSFLSSQPLPQLVQPHLQKLAYDLDDSCGVTVLDGDHVVYIARITINRLVGARLSVGSRLPAYCTAGGRVLLGSLDEKQLAEYLRTARLSKLAPKTLVDRSALRTEVLRGRKQGWYITDQQIEPGVRSVAAPLHDAQGNMVAAINVSSYSTRVTLQTLQKKFVPRVLSAARAIESEMHASVVPSILSRKKP